MSNTIKIYLDDEREVPDQSWIKVKRVDTIIELLENNDVSEISLDHDLGTTYTGYDVLLWIEEKVYTEGYKAPIIRVHSANSGARNKMELAIESINRYFVR